MVLFIKALNERLLAYGVRNVRGIVSDPGISASSVNIQHDLTKSLGERQRRSSCPTQPTTRP